MRIINDLTPAQWLEVWQHLSMGFTLALIGWSLLRWWRPREPARRPAARRLRVICADGPPPVSR
jgi:hypothetical protein